MSLPSRAFNRLRREARKLLRLRQASRLGVVYHKPNFIFRDVLGPNSIVVDVGCGYEADLSVFLMERHGLHAFAIDPTWKHRDSLAEVERRYPTLFRYFPIAVGPSSGWASFTESRINESGSLVASHRNVRGDPTSTYAVDVVTLEGLLERLGLKRADLLKLDIEGAEYEVLRDPDPMTLAPFEQLFVEFHHHCTDFTIDDTKAIAAGLSDCGYAAFSLDDHNYLFFREGVAD